MLAKKVAANLRQKLDIKICEEIFLNDSRVGLSYIQNTKNSFKTLWQIGSIKSKVILMCHNGITLKQMKTQ